MVLAIFTTELTFENLSMINSISACFIMASVYVGSLYLWRQENRYKRNEPDVIKRRFLSVSLSCIFSLVLLYLLGEPANGYSLADWIGIRIHSPLDMIKSSLVALFLTMILFLGPIVQFVVSHTDYNNNNRIYHLRKLKSPLEATLDICRDIKCRLRDLCFLRNYLISPFTEEFVFRSCMLPLLAPRLLTRSSVLVTPLFFGLAHLHHIVEGLKTNSASLSHLLAQHFFQFVYTYVFGVYSSYLFVRTGCFLPSFLIHSFCNLMGFPHVDELLHPSDLRASVRFVIVVCYFVGFFLFFRLLAPFTEPHFFENDLYFKFAS